MLLSAKEKHHPVYVWRIIGDKKIMAQVQIDLVLSARGELRISPKPEAALAFSHVVGGCSSVNLFFPNSSTLFQAIVKGGHGETGLIVSFPDFIAQMERRNWLRMSGENHAKLRLQFNRKMSYPNPMKQFFSKALSDVSAGGVSFLVTRAELRFLPEGEALKDIELIVEGKKIKLHASVLRIQELSKQTYPAFAGKTYKVSLRFDHIEKKDQEILAKFIFQNLPETHQAV